MTVDLTARVRPLPAPIVDGGRDGLWAPAQCAALGHHFEAPDGRPWERCVVCHLGEAAHRHLAPLPVSGLFR